MSSQLQWDLLSSNMSSLTSERSAVMRGQHERSNKGVRKETHGEESVMTRFDAGALTIMFAIAALAACATPKPSIRANLDASANMSAYRTYGFLANPGTNRNGYSTPLTSYFKEAVRREMNARGYRYEESDPDLLVNFNANAREQVDVRSTPRASVGMGYYGYRSGIYGTFPLYPYGNDVDTVRYKVGTANVDVVDARKKQLIWEGIAEGKLTKEIMNDPRAAVNAVVTQIFEKFPGRAAAAP